MKTYTYQEIYDISPCFVERQGSYFYCRKDVIGDWANRPIDILRIDDLQGYHFYWEKHLPSLWNDITIVELKDLPLEIVRNKSYFIDFLREEWERRKTKEDLANDILQLESQIAKWEKLIEEFSNDPTDYQSLWRKIKDKADWQDHFKNGNLEKWIANNKNKISEKNILYNNSPQTP